MVSQASVQSRVGRGFGKAAAKLGARAAWYRPFDAGPVIVPERLLGWVPVLFDTAADLEQRRPQTHGQPAEWYAALDTARGIEIGDYLDDPAYGTFFVATLDFFRPLRCVSCNARVTVRRPVPAAPGASFYGGGNEEDMIVSWPAAVTQGTKGERGDVGLPAEVRMPWVQILLPAASRVLRVGDAPVIGPDGPPITTDGGDPITTDDGDPILLDGEPLGAGILLRSADVVVVDPGQRRYVVSSAELTSLGWRLTASLQAA